MFLHVSQLLVIITILMININLYYSDWLDGAPPESVLRVLICLRLLIRDAHHQVQLTRFNALSKIL